MPPIQAAPSTPAPAAPSTPAPVTPPSAQSQAPVTQDHGDDPFSKLDARASQPKAKPAEPAKVDDKGKPKEPVTDPAPDLKDPRRLRSAFDLKSAELTRTKTALTDLERRLQEAEARGKDTTALAERIAAVEKERDEMQGQVRALRQEESPEFKKQYVKPFNDAAEFAKQVVEKLEVNVLDEAGQPTGQRPAKWDDFAMLYNLPFNKAVKMATQLFGDAAQSVINHISELQRLDFLKKRGLDEERANYKQREEAEKADGIKKREAVGEMWRKVNQDLLDRHPEWQAAPDDKEGAEILKEGYALADSALHDKDLPLPKKVMLDANVRHRAAIQPFYAHKLNQATERIKELEATVAELKGSGPGATQRPGGEAQPAKEDSWEADLRKNVPETPG